MVHINSGKDTIQMVTLDKTGKKSFGICIVKGEVKDSPNTKTSGIFIKGIVPDSPGHLCGKLKVGDRILTLNNNNVRNATEQEVIELIKEAGMKIHMEIQTYSKINDIVSENQANGFVPQNRNFGQEQTNKTQMSGSSNVNNNNTSNVKSEVMNKRNTFNASMKVRQNSQQQAQEEDEEDTRNMTGRIRTAAGTEIDRASAGNFKLNKMDKDKDKDQEDEFGYTTMKINKRYNMLKDVRKLEIERLPNKPLGLALAGHSDRQRMACFVAGVDPNGLLQSHDIKTGDEIIEVNGCVLQNRCHLNASNIFKNLEGEKIVLIVAKTNDGLSVKPINKFPTFKDDTIFIFQQFPNARTVKVRKEGFLGIMIIYGKHVEVGNGIFISDLREESNAALAGVKVGDMLLAVNQDVTLESTYDEAVALIKRAEGNISFILLTLKSEDSLRAEKEAEEKKKAEAKAEAEKPQDPSVAEIKPNKKIIIEVKVEKKPLGVIVTGGKNNFIKTGCVITHIYPQGAIALDNRLQIMDQIVEFNGVPIDCNELTTLKVHQLFHTPYEKIVTLQVYRADPFEEEKFTISFTKKPGKELGLSLAVNDRGCTISGIIPGVGCAEVENKLQRGDIIAKFNNDGLQGLSFEQCYALLKGASGSLTMEIVRPKPTCRVTTK